MKNRSRRKQVLAGTLLLTIASFVAKLLSAVYRIPFQNMVGNIGFYVYQQIYPIYGIGMTFALTGLPVFISKLVVDTREPENQVALVFRIQRILLVICLVIFCILQFGAGLIAVRMDDSRLTPVIQSVSWMFLLIPFLSSWRGYFQGKMEMRPTAYSQVIEQIVRVSVILVVAYWATHHAVTPYKMGQFAMLSAPIAGVFALTVILAWVWVHRPVRRTAKSIAEMRQQPLVSRILLEGGTLCLVSAVMLLLQLADSFSVVSGLRSFGYTLGAAQNIKGIYDRSQTLVQLGQVLSTASVTAVLPGLVMAHKRHQDVTFEHIATTNLRTNLALSLAMSVGLFALMPEVNRLLFSSAELNGTISLYCTSIVLTSVLMTYNAILQSKNQYKNTMAAILFGFVVKLLINQPLIAYFGIIGASMATLLSLVSMVLLLHLLARRDLQRLISGMQVIKLSVVLGLMWLAVHSAVVVVNAMSPITSLRLQALVIAVVCIPVGIIFFFGGCLVLKVFSVREWLAIPLVSKYIKIKGVPTHENR